jgi:hypothetical protein
MAPQSGTFQARRLREHERKTPVTLFFFDCVTPAEAVECDFGLELPHLHAARRHARRLAERMMASEPEERDWREWSVEISDRSGHRLSVVPFLHV